MTEATLVESWRRALDACPGDLVPRGTPAAEFAHGLLLLLAGEPGGALTVLERSAAAMPAARTLYVLGLAQAEGGDPDGALASFERTLEADPDLVPAWYHAAAALRRLDRTPEEVSLLRRAVEHFRGTGYEGYVLNELAIALQRVGALEEAAACYRRASRCPGGDSVACRANLALLLERSGNRDEARELLDGVLAERSRQQVPHPLPHVSFLIYYVLGNLELADGRPVRAARHYRRSLELAPGSAPAWNSLAIACHAAGWRRQAASALRRALEIDPGLGAARRNLERLAGREEAA